MRNLSLSAAIFIITLSLFTGPEIQAQTAPNQAITDTAEVVFMVRNRVYLNIGTLAEINTDWQVRIMNRAGDTLQIPLAWCGEDLSYFINPAPADSLFAIGEMIELFYEPNVPSKNYSITLAYPEYPTLPAQTPASLYDFEFSNLLADRLFDLIKKNEKYYSFLYPKLGTYKSNGELLTSDDLYFSLYCNFPSSSLSGYILKSLIPFIEDADLESYFTDALSIPWPLVNTDISVLIRSANIRVQPCTYKRSLDKRAAITWDIRISPISSYAECTVSTGPYYFDSKNDNQIVLLRNKYYDGESAYPDSLIIKIIPDYLDRKLAFQLGQIDYLDINYTDKAQFQDDYQIRESETNLALYLSANNLKDYLDDGILTTALSYFINRESLCRVALGGMAEPLTAPPCLISNNSSEPYQYNSQKGRELLHNAGDIPKYLSLYIKPDDFITRRTAEYIKGLLARQNIYLTIYSEKDFQPGPSPEQFQEFDLMLSYIDLSSHDPLIILNQINFHYGLEDISANKSLYFSNEYDSLIGNYLWEPDTSSRKLLNYYQRLREIPSGIFLLQPKRLTAISNRLTGFEFRPSGTIDFSKIEISDEFKK